MGVGRFRWTFKRSLSSGHILVPFDLLNEFEIFLGGGFKDFLFLPQLSSLTNVFLPQAKQKPKAGWGLLFRVLMFCGEAILVRAWWVCKSCFFARKIEIPSTWGIIPVRTPVYKPFGPFGRTTIMVINHLLTGMIVQAGKKSIFDHGERNIMDPKEGYDVSSEQGMFPIFLTSHLFQVSGGKKDTNSWCLESLYSRLQVLDPSKSSDDSVWKVGSGDPFWKMILTSFSHMNQWLMTPSTSPEIRSPLCAPLQNNGTSKILVQLERSLAVTDSNLHGRHDCKWAVTSSLWLFDVILPIYVRIFFHKPL